MLSRFLHVNLTTALLLTLLVSTVLPQDDSTSTGSTSMGTRHTPFRGPLFQEPGSTAFSTDLHVHSSFSEGDGSMESYTMAGNEEELDIVWWSDHDAFFTHYHMISTCSFEAWEEASSTNESWSPSTVGEANEKKSIIVDAIDPMEYTSAVLSTARFFEGSSSLKLSCSSSSSVRESMTYQFYSSTKRTKRALGADISIRIAVYPEQMTSNAGGIIEIPLSLHEDANGSWNQYLLRYVLTTDSLLTANRSDLVYSIPVLCQPGEWNELDLAVTADAIKGFSWLKGIDNSLFQFNFGVESSLGDTAVLYFDDLEVDAALQGEPVMAVQREIMDSLSLQAPAVTQLQGIETDWRHLNIFGDGFALPDWDSIAMASGYMDGSGWISNPDEWKDFAASAVVDIAHANGHVVSYNHMFGANSNPTGGPDPQTILNDLLSAGVYGADILEVGYQARGGHDLDTHIWVWDELAKQGYFLTGIGVTDAHGIYPGNWANRDNRFISWIYSEEATRPSLVEGLKRGRVFFGDLAAFDGTLDLTTVGGLMMGQVVLTDRSMLEVRITGEGLTAGDQVRTYWKGQLVNTYTATGPSFSQTEVMPMDQSGTFVRVGVTTAASANKVFSNPIYFVASAPPGGIAFHKAGIDIGNIQSTIIDSFAVTAADTQMTAERFFMTIDGTGSGGVVVLDVSESVLPDSVRFTGLSGLWELQDTLLILTDLNGTGQIEISGASPVVVTIPDQMTTIEVSFPPIMLDDHVNDPRVADSLITWEVTGGTALNVTIDPGRIATVTVVDSQWGGTELSVFKATNPSGYTGADTVFLTLFNYPSSPVLFDPQDGDRDVPTSLTLLWNRVSVGVPGDTITYHAQVAIDSLFTGIVREDSVLSDTSVTFDSLDDGVVYHWRVRAFATAGYGPWSDAWRFTTIVAIPLPVTLNQPLDGTTINQDSVQLSWLQALPEIDRYWLETDTDSLFPSATIDSMLTDTSATLHGLEHDASYFWRVRAHNLAGWGEFSESWKFNLLIPPPAVTLLAPADDSTNAPTSLELVWLGLPDALDYQYQIAGDSLFATILKEDSLIVDSAATVDSLDNNLAHYWRVRARSSAGYGPWSDVWKFATIVAQPIAVLLLNPADDSVVAQDSVNLLWTPGSAFDDRYWVETDTDSLFASATIDSMLTDTSAVFGGLEHDSSYYWRVKAHNLAGWGEFSETWKFNVLIPPPAVTLLTPADDSLNAPTTVTLQWLGSNGATSYRYQVAYDSLFTTIVDEDSLLSDTSATSDSLDNSTIYYWRVQATNSAGYGPWSEVRHFTTIIALPAAASLIGPPEESIVPQDSVMLLWTSGSPFDDRYWLETDTDSLFASATIDSLLTDTSAVVSGLEHDSSYYWRVKAHNLAGWGEFSESWKFNVLIPPPAVTLVGPMNDHPNAPTPVIFEWHRLSEATVYRFQIATDSLFTAIFLDDSLLSDTTIAVDSLENAVTHYWRARARNSAGYGPWSEVWNFTTIIALPAAVSLEQPADNSLVRADFTTLRWFSGGETIDRYWLETDYDSLFSSATIDSAIIDTSRIVAGLEHASSYSWRVKAHNLAGWGEFSDTWDFNVLIPPPSVTLLAPADDSLNAPTSLQLVWLSLPEGLDFHYQIASDSLFTTIIREDSLLSDSMVTIDSLDNALVHYWRVRAWNSADYGLWSEVRSFTTIIALPAAVALIDPPDDSVVGQDSVMLLWTSGSPFNDRYWLETDTDSLFASATIDSLLTGTSAIVSGLEHDSSYYWRVKAHNLAGWGEFSESWKFNLLIPPPAVTLLAPADDSTNAPTSILIQWSAVPGSEDYKYQVSTDSLFLTVTAGDSLYPDSSAVINSLDNGVTYHWRVRGRNSAGPGSWSSIWSFRTIVEFPGPVTLLEPPDDLIHPDDSLTFRWSVAGPEVDRYWFEIDTTTLFSSAVIDSGITDTSTIRTGLEDGRRYYWKLRAHNAAGWGLFTTTRTFLIDIPPPAPVVPLLLLPPDGSTDQPVALSFHWTQGTEGARFTPGIVRSSPRKIPPVLPSNRMIVAKRALRDGEMESAGADSTTYHFQIGTDSTLSTILLEDSTLIDTTYHVDSLVEGTIYYWRVSARNEAGMSSWADPWTFTTIGATNPPIPCGAISSFVARCRPGGLIQMRITLPNSTEYAGEEVTFQVDTTLIDLILVTNGTHTRAQYALQNQSLSTHQVSLITPGGCFDPITVTCTASARTGDDDDDDWAWDEWFTAGFDNQSLVTQIPERTELDDNYPNPFNPMTTIRYSLTEESTVQLRVYNMLGQLVQTLVDEVQPAGHKSVVWNADSKSAHDVASGIYFAMLRVRSESGKTFLETKKLLLVR